MIYQLIWCCVSTHRSIQYRDGGKESLELSFLLVILLAPDLAVTVDHWEPTISIPCCLGSLFSWNVVRHDCRQQASGRVLRSYLTVLCNFCSQTMLFYFYRFRNRSDHGLSRWRGRVGLLLPDRGVLDDSSGPRGLTALDTGLVPPL